MYTIYSIVFKDVKEKQKTNKLEYISYWTCPIVNLYIKWIKQELVNVNNSKKERKQEENETVENDNPW